MGRPLDESDLIGRAKRGDTHAYEELVYAHQGIAFRTAYVIAGNAPDAEEAAQDGFVKAWRALGRFREGVYVNFLGGDEDPDRVREAYGDSVYDRLGKVKTTYDPDNVFHHNQNIRPGTGTRISGASRARPH